MSRVPSIERAFAVLGALADGPIGVTEVADRADLPKSTAARLLASLAREGVVEQVPGDSRYRLGPRLVTLAARIRPARTLAALARPSLEALAGSAGEAAGLPMAREGFADRAYNPDGTLVSRRLPGAVIIDPEVAADRALRLIVESRLTAVDGTELNLTIDSLCIHSDTPGAVAIAQAIRRRLDTAGVAVRPLRVS